MTPETKIIETGVMTVVAAIIVITNKKMFFETEHVGRLLEMQSDVSGLKEEDGR